MITTNRFSDIAKTTEVRDQAQQLLKLLLADRSELEKSLEEGGRRDQMKWVTGRSSLDNTITATEEIIESLDATLGQARAHSMIEMTFPTTKNTIHEVETAGAR